MKKSLTATLLAGDLIALLLFVLIGQADHGTINASNPLLGALRNVVSLVIPWLVFAWLLRAYPRVPDPSLLGFLGRTAIAWVLAVPIGLLIRMVWLGRGAIPIPFLLVTLAVGGLFLLGWRVAFWLVFLRPKQPAPAA